jgi:ADP-L-glycero-D-manno-heptose 6-epimerase
LENGIPFLYASSAATYGIGSEGFSDNTSPLELQPLNPYGVSKNEFDKWVLEQKEQPFFWAGFKFFNVFGPNEYHKGRMASVVMHAFNQIQANGKVNLFRSHHPDFEDGKQLRDFIYVKDVVDVILYMMENRPASGIYNLGTGVARSFLDLTKAVFNALDLKDNIEFIDTPIDIRDKYQYYTCADMQKLRNVGYRTEFTSLEEAVQEYVQQYLVSHAYYI